MAQRFWLLTKTPKSKTSLVTDNSIQWELDGEVCNVKVYSKISQQALVQGSSRMPKQCREIKHISANCAVEKQVRARWATINMPIVSSVCGEVAPFKQSSRTCITTSCNYMMSHSPHYAGRGLQYDIVAAATSLVGQKCDPVWADPDSIWKSDLNLIRLQPECSLRDWISFNTLH